MLRRILLLAVVIAIAPGCSTVKGWLGGKNKSKADQPAELTAANFDRHTGKVLANFGKGVMVTPHGISVDKDGNVWIADFAANKAGTKGHQVHKFSPKGEKLLSLGMAGKAGNADGQFNQPNDVVVGPDGCTVVDVRVRVEPVPAASIPLAAGALRPLEA